ncbi:Adenylyl-sulfate kinase [ANME-1 cluster archaeon GoMg1]|nr:Adenylyl-sulfate kinase [ANME-1 cluster archaeon GoMg1]
MKILICGKGGSGKSTIAALLAKSMANRGYQILVIDNDESNFGLHRQLGIKLPDDFMNYFGGKKAMIERMLASIQKGKGGTVKIFDKRWTFGGIPKEYLTKKNGIKLLAIGKIHEFGEGCACPMGAISTEMLKNLTLSDKEVVIVDSDAGIEHFGRGVEEGCEVILVILDPSFESIMLSKKINELADSIKKPVYFVLNKVDNESKQVMLASVDKNKIVGIVPADNAVFKACLAGKELDLRSAEIEKLAEFLGDVKNDIRTK